MDPADGDANAPFSGTPTGARPPPSAKDTPANSGDTQVAAFRRAAEAGRSLGLGFLTAGATPSGVPSEMRGGGAGISTGTGGGADGGATAVTTGEAVSPDEAAALKPSSSSPSKPPASAGKISPKAGDGGDGRRRRGARASRPTRKSSFDYTPHVRKYSRKGTAGSGDAKDASADAVPSSSESGMASVTVVRQKDDARAPAKRKRGPGRPAKERPPAKRGRGRPRKDAAGSGGDTSGRKARPPRKREPPPTPAELYERISKSRDRLFFVAYQQDEDDDTKSGGGRKSPSAEKGGKSEKHWYLVRVDVETAEKQLDMKPAESGEYYVEVRMTMRRTIWQSLNVDYL